MGGNPLLDIVDDLQLGDATIGTTGHRIRAIDICIKNFVRLPRIK